MAEFNNTVDVLGDNALADSIIERSIVEISDDAITKVGIYAFSCCSKLISVSFPAASEIGSYAFENCSALTTVNAPAVTRVQQYTFRGCSKLTAVDFPKATSISTSAFQNCSSLTAVNFPAVTGVSDAAFKGCSKLTAVDFSVVTSISDSVFNGCSSLTTLILRNESQVATLSRTNAFTSCYHIHGTVNSTYNPEGLKDGYIYVPSALVESYKAATNWSTFADQIRALEDYTIDGTTTGALDETKI